MQPGRNRSIRGGIRIVDVRDGEVWHAWTTTGEGRCVMSFDGKCYDLALAFLPEDATTVQCNELAQLIQDTIEDYVGDLETKQ